MNSSVISGTPRNTSINVTHSSFTTGRALRRPRASATPSGRQSTIPATASSRFSISPPQYMTDTGCRPDIPGTPRSNTSVSRKAAMPRMTIHRADPKGVCRATAHPAASDGRLASSNRRTSQPMLSSL